MSEQIARFKPGANVPGFAAAAVLAGRFVKISADKTSQGDYSITHCGAGQHPFGVSEQDSAAATEPAHSIERRVNVVRRGAIARVLAGDDLSAGEAVMSDANGKAVPLTDGAVAASLTVGTVNSQLVLTAKEPGEDGNDITIALVVTDANVDPSTVDVDGTDIVVTLKSTDVGSGTITETYAGLVAAINEHDVASQLVTATDGAGDGSGTVVALAETALAGGDDEAEGHLAGFACADYDSATYAEIDLI